MQVSRRDVPFATRSVPYGTWAGAEQQDGQRAEYREETVAEQGVSFCEIFLLGLKMSLQSSTTVLDDVHLCQI